MMSAFATYHVSKFQDGWGSKKFHHMALLGSQLSLIQQCAALSAAHHYLFRTTVYSWLSKAEVRSLNVSSGSNLKPFASKP